APAPRRTRAARASHRNRPAVPPRPPEPFVPPRGVAAPLGRGAGMFRFPIKHKTDILSAGTTAARPDHPEPFMRTHLAKDLTESLIDTRVSLCGWVHRRRDHGGVIFIDLRDRGGIVQVVADPDLPEPFAAADGVRSEFVIGVTGRVRARPAGTENPELATGTIEVLADAIEVLNPSRALPFQLDEEDVG